VYALLPNKTAATYTRLLAQLKVLQPALNPQTIMTDFEQSAINAFESEFPLAQQTGCFFHLCQNNWRKLQELGLTERFRNDAEFALQCKMVPSIAFVPVADVVQAFEEISRNLDGELDPLLDYFEETYIGPRNRRGAGRRAPRFAIALWNVFDRAAAGMARTNNFAEAQHRGLQTLCQMTHPTFWKFVKKLSLSQQKVDTNIEQLIAGVEPPQSRRMYRDINRRIGLIIADYNNRTKWDYIRGIAHNFDY